MLNATNKLQIPTKGRDLPQKFLASGARIRYKRTQFAPKCPDWSLKIRYFQTKIRPKFASQIPYHLDKVLQELPGAFLYTNNTQRQNLTVTFKIVRVVYKL